VTIGRLSNMIAHLRLEHATNRTERLRDETRGPGLDAAVRRKDARRSFLGLEVALENVAEERTKDLAGQA